MTTLILSLLLSLSSPEAQANYGSKIRAKDYSCAQIHQIIRNQGSAVLQFGFVSNRFYASPNYCSKFRKPQLTNFRAKGGERCRGIICVEDRSNIGR